MPYLNNSIGVSLAALLDGYKLASSAINKAVLAMIKTCVN